MNNILQDAISKLKQGTSEKLIYSYTDKAKHTLLKAYELFEKYEEKYNEFTSLKYICAYRLGHLIMRTAKNDDDLLEAEEFFYEAAKSKSLGPLPIIYRISVLYRLGEPKQRILREIKKAIEIIKDSENILEESLWDELPQLQNSYLNMLELSVYFSNIDYKLIEGLGLLNIKNDFSDLFSNYSIWMLSVTENLSHRYIGVHLPKELVKEEIELIIKNANFPIIGFIFDYSNSFKYMAKINSKDIIVRYGEWGTNIKKFFIFITELYKYRGCSSPFISGRLFNTSNTSILRTSKKRLKSYLKNIFQEIPEWKDLEIFVEDLSYELKFKLNPELRIIIGYDINLMI